MIHESSETPTHTVGAIHESPECYTIMFGRLMNRPNCIRQYFDQSIDFMQKSAICINHHKKRQNIFAVFMLFFRIKTI